MQSDKVPIRDHKLSFDTYVGFSRVTWLRRKLLASVMVVPWLEEDAKWFSYCRMDSFSDLES